MDPVEMHRCFSDHKSQVELRIHLSKAIMWASSEDQEVLCSLDFCVTGNISLRIIVIGVGVDFGIAESGVDGGNDHGA